MGQWSKYTKLKVLQFFEFKSLKLFILQVNCFEGMDVVKAVLKHGN